MSPDLIVFKLFVSEFSFHNNTYQASNAEWHSPVEISIRLNETKTIIVSVNEYLEEKKDNNQPEACEHLYSVNISRTELALAPTPAVIESPKAATTWEQAVKKSSNYLSGYLDIPWSESVDRVGDGCRRSRICARELLVRFKSALVPLFVLWMNFYFYFAFAHFICTCICFCILCWDWCY